MRAIIYERYGPPEVMRVAEVPRPEPGAGEVLIRVRASEATKADCELRSFRFAVRWFWLPLRLGMGVFRPRRKILGTYFAGEVVEVGPGVTRFSAGDAVYGGLGLRMGGYGEFVAVPEKSKIVAKPANLSFAEAAAVPLGGLNALHFLRLTGVGPGDSVLVNGAGGSIGLHGVQIAKALGAEVTAVDKPLKESAVRRLGADHFIDYTTQRFADAGRTFDVVFDMVAGSSFRDCMHVLKPHGRYCSGNPRLATMMRCVWASRFSDKTARFAFAAETLEELDTLRTMIESGQIRSIVEEVVPMERAAEAHRRVENETRTGAIVIAIGDP